MAVPVSSRDRLFVELEELERREREISAIRRRLHDRLDSFPNEVARRQEAAISAERRELHRRIDELRARLASDRDDSAGP